MITHVPHLNAVKGEESNAVGGDFPVEQENGQTGLRERNARVSPSGLRSSPGNLVILVAIGH